MILASFPWLEVLLPAVPCVAFGYGLHLLLTFILNKLARDKARTFLEERRAAVRSKLAQAGRQAQEESDRLRQRAGVDLDEDRETLRELDRRLQERSLDLGRKEEFIKEKQAELETTRRDMKGQEAGLRGLRRKLGRLRGEGRQILLDILGKTEEELQHDYLDALSAEVDRETSRFLERQNQALEEEAEARARNIVGRVVQRMQISHAREERQAAIEVPDVAILEERGIKPGSPLLIAFQDAAGVEVAIDVENGTVGFNTLDGVRREIARRAMSRILNLDPSAGRADADGEARDGGRSRRRKQAHTSRRKNEKSDKWTPERIKTLVDRTGRELRRVLNRKGRKASQVLKLPGNNKLFEYLGRLNFRTSYGQNILKHSQEVGFLGGMLGAEAGFEAKLAKRCAFLHDIGKCIDYEMEGGHPEIGGKLARECGEEETVVNAVEAHHDDVPRSSLYPLIVQAADAISGARPGARRRTAEKYLIRMGQIEDIANNKPGVESAYVIQAGREVRVILEADKTSDADAQDVAGAIARELEAEMNFPGKIKVTVIREKKVSAVAK